MINDPNQECSTFLRTQNDSPDSAFRLSHFGSEEKLPWYLRMFGLWTWDGDCQLTSPRQGPSSSPIQKGRGELLLRLLLKSQFSNKENPDKDIRPNWASSRCWIIFLSQAFLSCQIFCMTPRKLLRFVTTFSVGNFWKKSFFCTFLELKNVFLTSLKV